MEHGITLYFSALCQKNLTPIEGEAAEILNKIRNIRGVNPVVCTEANRLDEIEKEYRKEFYGEGQYTAGVYRLLSLRRDRSRFLFPGPETSIKIYFEKEPISIDKIT